MIPTDRLPLVLGIAGHRDIAADDEPPLRAAFASVLDDLAKVCRHTPLLVLSGLAAGADILAAEEAIARGVPVVACLPMPLGEYERDFVPSQLERFRTALAASARIVVASQSRENAYMAQALFVAQFSQILIAFWDGKPSRGAGGTGDIVNMRVTRDLHHESGADVPYLPDLGPVYQIVTPHAQSERPPEPFTVKRLYPQRFRDDTTVERDFATVLERIDLYNADLATTPAGADDGLKALVGRTDAAANRLHRRMTFFQVMLFVCAFLAAAMQIIGRLAIVKVGALVVAFIAYRFARRNDYENRYQDYRALAEGLRVQNVWWSAGLRHRLADKAYLGMQEGELQWIRMALRSAYLVHCEGREATGGSAVDPVCNEWIRSQWRYYYRACRTDAACQRRLGRGSRIALGVGIAISVAAAIALGLRGELLAVLLQSPVNPVGGQTSLLAGLLTVPLALAAVLGALFAHYSERENLTANARRYERMFHVFDRARRRLGRLDPTADASEIIFDLGQAALIEHADWLIMRRERPLKVVVV